MTKSEMDLWDSGMIGPALLIINQYFDCVISEYVVLWASLVSHVQPTTTNTILCI